MKAYWGSEDTAPAFLTSAPDGGEWSDSRPGRITLRERETIESYMKCVTNTSFNRLNFGDVTNAS